MVIIYFALVLFGLCLGSFAGASVWRLRSHQLKQDKLTGEPVDKDEYRRLKKITDVSVLKDRSQCLSCGYSLRWYDLLPLISWICLRGKCRKCHRPIGLMEPLIEIGVALFFVLSYMLWPYGLSNVIEIARFVIWLVAGVNLAILFAYDVKWFLMPDSINFVVIGLGLLSSILVFFASTNKLDTIIEIAVAAFILSGIYLILYLISHGKWIGFGDIKLGLGLALLLANWKLAFVALFSANLVGCLLVIPGIVSGKLKRNSHVPFGPLLIAGFLIAGLFGSQIVSFYLSLLA
jgi:leader peptidase (prepilin peptidase)/N-methyltransferase